MTDFILVRGVPVPQIDVILKQEELGAQLFDESVFADREKKVACANIIFALDTALARFRVANPTRLPDAFDIGDSSWLYIPVDIFAPETGITTGPSKDKPVGLIGWFRIKKYYRVTRRAP